jgi:site-specific recombinase XerD
MPSATFSLPNDDRQALPAPRPAAPAPAVEHELERAAAHAQSSLVSTRRAYERDWRAFASWCAPRGLAAMPAAPATVAAFLASEADREFRPVTIDRRAAAIAAAHRAQDHPNPCDSGAVAAVLAGVRRQHGTRPLRQAARLELEPLGRLLEPIDASTLAGRRDRALILVGFAAALRRAELVALDVEDLQFDTSRGLMVTIRASKTDQETGRSRRRRAVRARVEFLLRPCRSSRATAAFATERGRPERSLTRRLGLGGPRSVAYAARAERGAGNGCRVRVVRTSAAGGRGGR